MKIRDQFDMFKIMNGCGCCPYPESSYGLQAVKLSKYTVSNFMEPVYLGVNFYPPSTGPVVIIGGRISYVFKRADNSYVEYFYASGKAKIRSCPGDGNLGCIDSGGGLLTSIEHPTGGESYPIGYSVTSYEDTSSLDATCKSDHASQPYLPYPYGDGSVTFGKDVLSSYFFPYPYSGNSFAVVIEESKYRWIASTYMLNNYRKITWNLITWTKEYKEWWVAHLQGSPEPFPEPSEKPSLGPLLSVEWHGPGSGPPTDPSWFAGPEFSIPVPLIKGHITEIINYKSYVYQSTEVGGAPLVSPFIY